ncbi:hypothetical protein [Geoalkalibacter halelectricus]|uniref:hypothetical protein n=1 Tax=Geoalkalibacter halelectricus TaxID=2847045 RepID=UPI003D1EFC08
MKQIAKWSRREVKRQIAHNLQTRPMDFPSAFVSPQVPEPLRRLYLESHTTAQFQAKLAETEMVEMFHSWSQTWAEVEHDALEFSVIELQEQINREVFRGQRVLGAWFHVFQTSYALRHRKNDVEMALFATDAKKFLNALAPTAASIILWRIDDGFYVLAADEDFFVLEEIDQKVAADIAAMDEPRRRQKAFELRIDPDHPQRDQRLASELATKYGKAV